jgi:hypothetical protein
MTNNVMDSLTILSPFQVRRFPTIDRDRVPTELWRNERRMHALMRHYCDMARGRRLS